jgi:hypothetical protein
MGHVVHMWEISNIQSFTKNLKGWDHVEKLDVLKWFLKELLCRLDVQLSVGSSNGLVNMAMNVLFP